MNKWCCLRPHNRCVTNSKDAIQWWHPTTYCKEQPYRTCVTLCVPLFTTITLTVQTFRKYVLNIFACKVLKKLVTLYLFAIVLKAVCCGTLLTGYLCGGTYVCVMDCRFGYIALDTNLLSRWLLPINQAINQSIRQASNQTNTQASNQTSSQGKKANIQLIKLAINQSSRKSIKQAISQSINQSSKRLSNQPSKQANNYVVNQPSNQSIEQNCTEYASHTVTVYM